MDSFTDLLFRDLRIIFRKAMDQDLEMIAKVLKFREKWQPILSTLEDHTWRYVDLNDEDWEDFMRGVLGGE